MKRVLLEEQGGTILIGNLGDIKPVFVYGYGELVGMVVRDTKGWIVRIGGATGAFGYKDSLEELIRTGMNKFGYEFKVN